MGFPQISRCVAMLLWRKKKNNFDGTVSRQCYLTILELLYILSVYIRWFWWNLSVMMGICFDFGWSKASC